MAAPVQYNVKLKEFSSGNLSKKFSVYVRVPDRIFMTIDRDHDPRGNFVGEFVFTI